MDFTRNSGMFVHFVFFKDYVDQQDAKNKYFTDQLYTFSQAIYALNTKATNLEAHINTLEDRINKIDKGGTN